MIVSYKEMTLVNIIKNENRFYFKLDADSQTVEMIDRKEEDMEDKQ